MNKPLSKQPLPENAKKVFNGIIFDVYQWEQLQFDGTVKIFEKLKRDDTALIIPILEDGNILLLEQEQPGKPPFIGFAGGRIDKGEDPLEGAKRELREETGYEASEWELIDAVQPVSKIEWSVYTYVARGCRPFGSQSLDSGERIQFKPISFDGLVEIMARDDFHDKEGMLGRFALRALYDPSQREQFRKLLYGME
ncbi:MAG TPA: NUDIX hydrolase [Patescibacteria group bacterium]